jgi:hypothetical protein
MSVARSRKRIEDLRFPVVNGLPDDTYHMLHHSFVDILRMCRSIESADAHINTSMKAVSESWGNPEARADRAILTPHAAADTR